jgi:hypothetical protein
MTESMATLIFGLLVAGLISLTALWYIWKLSARRAERRLLAADEEGYGPMGRERVTALQAELDNLSDQLSREQTVRRRAETEAAALLRERDDARQEQAVAREERIKETTHLTGLIEHWRRRNEALQALVTTSQRQATELRRHSEQLLLTLHGEAALQDTGAATHDEQGAANEMARERPQTPDSSRIMPAPASTESVEAARAPVPAAPSFLTGERPAPEDMPALAARFPMPLPTDPAAARPGKMSDESETGERPEPIDIDELARRIRALETGV